MTHPLRRLTAAAVSVGGLAAAPMAGVIVFSPAVSSACLPGETGVTNNCAPFCLPGKALDVEHRVVYAGAGPRTERRQSADQRRLP